MGQPIKLHYTVMLLLVFACAAWPVELRSDRDAGRRSYAAGDFKKAVLNFKRAVAANPNDADSHFWLGKSYEMQADIGGLVLGSRASSKAHAQLAQALQLAPANEEYRREYFDFLVMSDHSPGALREAEAIIQMTPRSDPDYPSMSMELQKERDARSSVESRITAAFALAEQPLAIASRRVPPSSSQSKAAVTLQSKDAVTLLAQSGQ
jgi:tetratricopeptide (TPR) repeat protein